MYPRDRCPTTGGSPRRSRTEGRGAALRRHALTRLARTHAAAVAGDTLIALAPANSLFFDIDPNAARGKVTLYLALTMAPFAVVAPLIGLALDLAWGGRRFGHRGQRAAGGHLRADDPRHRRAAAVPRGLRRAGAGEELPRRQVGHRAHRGELDAELVEANSRLSFLSGVITFAAAAPGGLAFLIAGQLGVLVLAVVVFTVAAVLGVRVPGHPGGGR